MHQLVADHRALNVFAAVGERRRQQHDGSEQPERRGLAQRLDVADLRLRADCGHQLRVDGGVAGEPSRPAEPPQADETDREPQQADRRAGDEHGNDEGDPVDRR